MIGELALAAVATTSSCAASGAWRDAAAAWERRAETCLVRLEARTEDLAGCQLLRELPAPAAVQVVRPRWWWVGGLALGGAAGVAGTGLAACPDRGCQVVAGVAAGVLAVVGAVLTVAF